MTLNNIPSTPNAEVRRGSTDQQLKEWRLIAIAEGIPPQNVDENLIKRIEVPESVKQLIRSSMGQNEAASNNVSPRSSGESFSEPSNVNQSSHQESFNENSYIQQNPESGVGNRANVEMSDSVDVSNLDVKAKMDQIRESMNVGATPEYQEPGQNFVDQKPEQQPVQTQTAEQKELTTTQGLGNTTQGVSKIASMIDDDVYGYQPDATVAQKAEEISNEEPVEQSKTWQALALKRIYEMWGSFKNLFGQQK
ncbi:hypothetical protein JW887_06645 [Candidatus Dojkabacteria bacterium]|nr:hypothetical protein [Candidatus Dojkabacteria bacterium]